MRRNITAIIFILCVFCAVLCASCAARISGALDQGGAGDFTAAVTLQPRISALIKSLKALADDKGTQIVDGRMISESMTLAPGVESAAFKNTSPQAIEGQIKIARAGDFLTSGNAGFITFEQNAGAGGKCSINISRELGPEILARISPEVSAYLEALMAPIVTGEEIGGKEYLALVESVYGKGIADEIASSDIRAVVEFPGAVQSARGGTFSGRRVEFQIPLLDLLVLERPLNYEAVWR